MRYVVSCASCPGGCEEEVSFIQVTDSGKDKWRLQSNGREHSASGSLLPYRGKGIGGEFEYEVAKGLALGMKPRLIVLQLKALCGNDHQRLQRVPDYVKIGSFEEAHKKDLSLIASQLDSAHKVRASKGVKDASEGEKNNLT